MRAMKLQICSIVANVFARSPSAIVTTSKGIPGSTSTPMPLWVTTVARRAPGGTLSAIAARTPGPTSTS